MTLRLHPKHYKKKLCLVAWLISLKSGVTRNNVNAVNYCKRIPPGAEEEYPLRRTLRARVLPEGCGRKAVHISPSYR